MDLLILIIKLLMRGSDSDPSPRYQNVPTFIPPAAPPPLPQAAQQQMGNQSSVARPGKRKTAGKRPPAKAGQKAAPVALAAPVVPVSGIVAQPANAMSSAAPAQLIAEALRSPKNFAAAVLMTELLRPSAALRDIGITS